MSADKKDNSTVEKKAKKEPDRDKKHSDGGEQQTQYMAIGMCVGVALGIAFMNLFGAVSLCYGISFGMLAGVIIDESVNKKRIKGDAAKSVYQECPVFENDNYILRLVESSDCEDLLKVYSDEQAVPLFNSDNCGGDDFYYTTKQRMQEAIDYWLFEYGRQGFVRWTVIDKKADRAIGTIELFNRKSDDYFNNCGILRLDLISTCEERKQISEILSMILSSAFDMFGCDMIATKVIPQATQRAAALKELGFRVSSKKLIGHDKTEYTDYFVLNR